MKTKSGRILLIAAILGSAACSAVPHSVREKTWPLEMAITGTVRPWGEGSSKANRDARRDRRASRRFVQDVDLND